MWIVISVLVVGLRADDNEEAVDLQDCPKVVQKTLKRESKGGKIVEIEKEKEDGKTIYEAEVMIGGKEYEVEIAECGTLLSKVLEAEEDEEDAEDEEDNGEEVGVKLSDLPKSVRKTLKREAIGGKIEEIEKEKEGGETVFEAEVEIDGNEYEIEIASDGTLLSKILEDEDEEDDDNEEDDN